MSNFKHNFSELLLLANKNIVFEDLSSDFSFELVPVKVEDMFFNEDLNTFINLLDTDLDKLSKNFNTKLSSYLTFLILACTLGERREELEKLSRAIQNSMSLLIPGTEFNGRVFVIEEYLLQPLLFDEIISILFKILGKEKIIINESDDEFTRAEKKARLRAQQIKKSGKKDSEGSKMEDVLLALIYEYPQYKLEDLFQLNIYTFNYLFSKVGQIANYEVSKIAAGNGLTKKHRYLIGKK